jgi:hypothetical protein
VDELSEIPCGTFHFISSLPHLLLHSFVLVIRSTRSLVSPLRQLIKLDFYVSNSTVSSAVVPPIYVSTYKILLCGNDITYAHDQISHTHTLIWTSNILLILEIVLISAQKIIKCKENYRSSTDEKIKESRVHQLHYLKRMHDRDLQNESLHCTLIRTRATGRPRNWRRNWKFSHILKRRWRDNHENTLQMCNMFLHKVVKN